MVAHVAAAPNATEGQPLFGGPGQSVTVSIRTIWAAVAIACIVLVVAYVMGYKQHERKTLDDRTKLTQEQFDGVVDPTLNPSGTSPAASSTPVNPSLISPGPGERRPIDGAGTGGEGASSLLIVKRAQDDPREEGMNYFIVANLPFDEAKRAGDFLAGRGVASALLPRDNRGFCQVVALRGFPAGTLDSTECVQYKERLRSIGREYKRTQKGPTDFADLFPRKYRRATG
ncbi:MAG TPA: hypothetical protein VG797_09670 [Phycisphaerales bacterium]|nr:hypothetical protein [Phycisphaerales bacterium]